MKIYLRIVVIHLFIYIIGLGILCEFSNNKKNAGFGVENTRVTPELLELLGTALINGRVQGTNTSSERHEEGLFHGALTV